VNKDRLLEEMLEECLAAHDAGLEPEECLSAWPDHRVELEPLFRQALLLRVAYANAPAAAFQQRLRQKLLFTAGKDVSQALAAEPDELFVTRTRARLVHAAGAQAQEALRNVPPPRLPFWINARRRLLETAAAPPTRPRQVFQPFALVMRTGLSAAVVVLAIAVAGIAFLSSQSSPPSVSAQLEALEQKLDAVEQQAAAGEHVAPNVLIELSRETNAIAEKLNTEQAPPPLVAKLPEIIDRQRDVVNHVVSDTGTAAEIRQAQQQLTQAEEKVRVLAARVEQPTQPPATQEPATATPPAAAVSPTAPAVVPTAAPIVGDQVRISLSPTDATYGLSWVEIRTATIRFVIPSNWKVVGVTPNATGVATFEGNFLRIDGPNVLVIVNTKSGEINALLDGQPVELLSEDRELIGLSELIEVAGLIAPELRHLLESVELSGSVTGVTPPPSATPRPAATPTP
jgi:hypothetical protein